MVRRLFLLALALILPVQFALAAAAGYCQHETGEAAEHFGHHEHQHRATHDGAAQDSKAPSTPGVDNDCGVCQFSAAQLVPSTTAQTVVISAEPPRFAFGARYCSHIPSGPERPDRTAPTPAVRFGGAVMNNVLLLLV